WEASAFPVSVGDLEINPREAPAKQYGYEHLLVVVGFHAQPLTMSIPFWVMAHTMP
ncbi:hypothetical protein UFOVP982_1, partial [uncultured Caudovirales phage]